MKLAKSDYIESIKRDYTRQTKIDNMGSRKSNNTKLRKINNIEQDKNKTKLAKSKIRPTKSNNTKPV